jgi:hypothetical protein
MQRHGGRWVDAMQRWTPCVQVYQYQTRPHVYLDLPGDPRRTMAAALPMSLPLSKLLTLMQMVQLHLLRTSSSPQYLCGDGHPPPNQPHSDWAAGNLRANAGLYPAPVLISRAASSPRRVRMKSAKNCVSNRSSLTRVQRSEVKLQRRRRGHVPARPKRQRQRRNSNRVLWRRSDAATPLRIYADMEGS